MDTIKPGAHRITYNTETGEQTVEEVHFSGVELIANERQRQIEKEGWTPEHDDGHCNGELSDAAACYAIGKATIRNLAGHRVDIWPWSKYEWKPTPDDRMRELVKAGALIAAEIDRLQREATA